jgi:thiamine-phosphate pyrophosphorylase
MHHDQSTVLRILDANFNRCCEGLRVVEEYLRFVLEDPQLATECKEIRHAVTTVLAPLAVEQLHAARDATGDIGATIGTEAEYERSTPLQVAAASLKRAQQALRALEEYSKLISPRVATGIEPLRYRTYTLERAVTLTCRSLIRLEQAHIYVLLDGRHSLDEFEHLATDLIRGGADIIQLRDKNLTDRELLARAQLLRAVTRGTKTLMIVNDRLDLALLAQADGVHLGQDEISVKNAREILGPEALIGLSTHTIEQAREAVLTGADYLGCGPTFPSATKSFEQYAGLEFLRQVHKETRRPSFAIGGIDRENLQQVVSTGFNRIAVRHAVTNADDPIMVLKEMRKTLSLPDE